MANITYQDILNTSKGNEDIYSMYGQTGKNAAGTWAKRIMQPAGANLANQVTFGANELEPARQDAYRYLIGMMQPGNMEASTARTQSAIRSGGKVAGQQAGYGAAMRGLSPEFAQMLMDSYGLQAQEQSNEALIGEETRKAQMMEALAGLTSQGQQAPGMDLFQMLYGDIEGRNAQIAAQKAQNKNPLGSMLTGGLGTVLGGIDFSKLFGKKKSNPA